MEELLKLPHMPERHNRVFTNGLAQMEKGKPITPEAKFLLIQYEHVLKRIGVWNNGRTKEQIEERKRKAREKREAEKKASMRNKKRK